jgi:hypothetical protein
LAVFWVEQVGSEQAVQTEGEQEPVEEGGSHFLAQFLQREQVVEFLDEFEEYVRKDETHEFLEGLWLAQ